MLNRLFPLRKPPLFLTGNINQDGWNTNQNQMKNTCFFYIVFQVWKVLLKELVRHTYQIFYFLLFYTVILAFTTSADHFPQIFRTSFNIWKKDVCHDFSFFNEFTQTPYPQRPKSAKHDERFLSMLLYFLCCRPNLKMLCMVLKSMVIFVKYHTCMLLLDCIGDHNWTSSSREHFFLIFLVIHCSYSCAVLLPYMLLS